MATKSQAVVTLEQFTRDLWEALRDEMRDQLGDSLSAAEFNKRFPHWEDLPKKVRDEKIRATRDDTLRIIDRAGYEVRRKA